MERLSHLDFGLDCLVQNGCIYAVGACIHMGGTYGAG